MELSHSVIKEPHHTYFIQVLQLNNTYFPFTVDLAGGLGIGLTGVESPRQLTHSHFPVGRDFRPTQNVW